MTTIMPDPNGHFADAAMNAYTASCSMCESTEAQTRPSWLFRDVIRVSMDGDQHCVLFGESSQEGVVGFGKTMAEAMAAFDADWNGKAAKK